MRASCELRAASLVESRKESVRADSSDGLGADLLCDLVRIHSSDTFALSELYARVQLDAVSARARVTADSTLSIRL